MALNKIPLTALVAAMLLPGGFLVAQADFSTPFLINTTAAQDSSNNEQPSLATDGAGHWVAAWSSDSTLGATIGRDADILMARSSNNGSSWTAPAPLNSNAATDSGDDIEVRLACDGAGVWVAVWASNDSLGFTVGSDYDILYARSTNNGATWSDPQPLNLFAAVDAAIDLDVQPDIVYAGSGAFVIAWYNVGSGTTAGSRIFAGRSINRGETWPAQGSIMEFSNTVGLDAGHPHVTAGANGAVVAAWHSNHRVSGGLDDYDLWSAHSPDYGNSWMTNVRVNHDGASDNFEDRNVTLVSDYKGYWLAVWEAVESPVGDYGTDTDIFWARSIDVGATWSDRAPLNTTATTDTRQQDAVPWIASDLKGNWITVWSSFQDTTPSAAGAVKVLFAQSVDHGTTWTAPDSISSATIVESTDVLYPCLVTDEATHWLAAWNSSGRPDLDSNSDLDILGARATVAFPEPEGEGEGDGEGTAEGEGEGSEEGSQEGEYIYMCYVAGPPDTCTVAGPNIYKNDLRTGDMTVAGMALLLAMALGRRR